MSRARKASLSMTSVFSRLDRAAGLHQESASRMPVSGLLIVGHAGRQLADGRQLRGAEELALQFLLFIYPAFEHRHHVVKSLAQVRDFIRAGGAENLTLLTASKFLGKDPLDFATAMGSGHLPAAQVLRKAVSQTLETLAILEFPAANQVGILISDTETFLHSAADQVGQFSGPWPVLVLGQALENLVFSWPPPPAADSRHQVERLAGIVLTGP